MRILFISDLWAPFPGGAERFISNVAKALQDRGNFVQVLTGYHQAEQQGMFINATSLNEAVIQTVFNAYQPDCVFTHHHFAYLYESLIFSFPVPVFQLVHSRPRIKRAAMAIFNSAFTAKEQGFVDGDMIILPPAGNDIVADYHGDAIGINKGWHHKGIDFAYRLAIRTPNRQFILLRSEWEGEDIRTEYPNFEIMNPVKDMRDYYKRIRISIMPNWTEEAGTIPQESALNNIPCISTAVGGLPETNKGGIILERDENEWLREFNRLDDPTYYKEVTDRQLKYVQSLNWTAQFDELDRRMKEICHV